LKQHWQIIANKRTGKATIFIYGYIDSFGAFSASEFVKQLTALEKDHGAIDVRINSGGGDVFEGIAIFNAMQRCKAKIETFIDGLAASMASIIALGGDKVHMAKNARMMIHQASGGGHGKSDDLRNTADVIDGINTIMAATYAGKSGKTSAEVKEKWMNGKDNWLTAEDALADKLIDAIYDGDEMAAPTASTEKEICQHYELQFAAKLTELQNPNLNMEFKISAAMKAALNIADNADQTAIDAAFNSMQVNAAWAVEHKPKYDAAIIEKDAAVLELNTIKTAANTEKVEAIYNAGLAAGKFTKEAGEILKADYATNADGFKKVVDAMPAYKPIAEHLTAVQNAEVAELAKQSGDALYKNGGLEKLKALDMPTFKVKYKEAFGTEYTGK